VPAGLRPSAVPAPAAEIETTGTFKQRKIDLIAEGFDPAAPRIRSTSATRQGLREDDPADVRQDPGGRLQAVGPWTRLALRQAQGEDYFERRTRNLTLSLSKGTRATLTEAGRDAFAGYLDAIAKLVEGRA
jgi:hypothetical protein